MASVVLIDPPFSLSVGREDPTTALRHVLSTAKRLALGGRLVAILPHVACRTRQPRLWDRLIKRFTSRLSHCLRQDVE